MGEVRDLPKPSKVTSLEAPPAALPRDMGEIAQELRWRLGAKGALAVQLDSDNQIHVGISELPPQLVRQVACALIHSSYETEKQQAALRAMSVPIIGR